MKIAALAASCLLVCSTAAAQTAPPKMDGYPAPGEPAKLTVIAPGSNPAKLPQHTPPAGYKEHMDMSLTLGMAMDIAGMQTPTITAPMMKMGFDFEVTNVSPAGEMTVAMTGTGVTSDGPPPDPMFANMLSETDRQIKTVKGTLTVDRDGRVIKQDLDVSGLKSASGADASQQIKNSLRDMRPEMPKEGLGAGSKWEVRSAIDSGGMITFQKVLNEVVALDADSVTIKTSLEQTAPSQKIVNDMLPPGTDVSLESAQGTGSGTIRMRFDRLVPSSDGTMKLVMKMLVAMSGQSQPMGMTMDMKIVVAGTVIK
jgi:hypothetical protein